MVRQINRLSRLLIILLLTATVSAAASPSLNLSKTGQLNRPTELHSRTHEALNPAINGERGTNYQYAPVTPYSSAVVSTQIISVKEVPIALHSVAGHHNGWLMAGAMIAMISIMIIAVMY